MNIKINSGVLTVIATAMLLISVSASNAKDITVYKSPKCGCCNKWIEHLREAGFNVTAENSMNMSSIKRSSGVRPELHSCHTALVDGYVIEGHVPAKDIKRLLNERPDVTGLTVPGMPMGSPGMEGHRQDQYDVLIFKPDRKTAIFSRY